MSVFLHCDMDAFYCQVEQVRLGISDIGTPVAVQQWQGLIATNYPARAFSITRSTPLQVARLTCPSLVLVHVPTYKLGDSSWRYRDDNPRDQCKVSLEVYRAASKRVFAILERFGRVEKASIDEAYIQLDFSSDPSSSSSLLFDAVEIKEILASAVLPGNHPIDHDFSPLDLNILKGIKVARDIRKAVLDELNYTISIGVSGTKLVSKLLSSHYKPDKLSAIFSQSLLTFMHGIKFKKIGSFGGKHGQSIASRLSFNYEDITCGQLMTKTRQEFEDIGSPEVYDIIRGQYHTKLDENSDLKSMLSAKSFSTSSIAEVDCLPWLELLCCELYERMKDEYDKSKRWPRSLVLQGQNREGKVMTGQTISVGRFHNQRDLIKTIVKCFKWCPGIARLNLQCISFTTERDITYFFKHAPNVDADQVKNVMTISPLQTPSLKEVSYTKTDNFAIEFSDEPSKEESGHVVPNNNDMNELPVLNSLKLDVSNDVIPVLFKCSLCNQTVFQDDLHEHQDYHIALNMHSREEKIISSAMKRPHHQSSSNSSTKKKQQKTINFTL